MIRLRRPLWARLLSGARLQALVALLVVLVALRAIGLLAGVIHDNSAPLGATLLVLLALVVLLAVGATGYAVADETGVRWRYYARHAHAWSEIERVDLEAVGVSLIAVRHTVSLRVAGRRHVITPASDGGSGRVEFGRDLAAAATARGIPVVDRWP